MLLQLTSESWLWFCIAILACWRMTHLLCYERGPFSLLNQVRKWFYRIGIGAVIDCFHCCSIWIALMISVLIYSWSWALPFLILAIAGGSSIIEKLLQHEYDISHSTEANKHGQ